MCRFIVSLGQHITHTRPNIVHTGPGGCHLILGKSYEHQSIGTTSLFWCDYHKIAICLGISFRLQKIKMSRGHEEGGDNSAIYHSHHHAHKELDVSWLDQKVFCTCSFFDTFAIFYLRPSNRIIKKRRAIQPYRPCCLPTKHHFSTITADPVLLVK